MIVVSFLVHTFDDSDKFFIFISIEKKGQNLFASAFSEAHIHEFH